MKATFTLQETRDYIEGFLYSDTNVNAISLGEVKTMLLNALTSLECGEDGIAATTKALSVPTEQQTISLKMELRYSLREDKQQQK